MTVAPHESVRRTLRSTVLLTAVTFLAATAAWWAWLGWDDEYYTDPATGYAAGPYRPWQVVGCVLTLLVIAGVAFWLLQPLYAGAAMTAGFTISFSSTALSTDESGLAMVGVLMVLVGMVGASFVVGAVVNGLRGSRRPAASPS